MGFMYDIIQVWMTVILFLLLVFGFFYMADKIDDPKLIYDCLDEFDHGIYTCQEKGIYFKNATGIYCNNRLMCENLWS